MNVQAPVRIIPLGEAAIIERSGVAPDKIKAGTCYLGLEHIASGGDIVEVARVDPGDLASTKFAFGPEHVLFGKLRPYLAKIALPDFEGVCSTDIVPIRPGPHLDRRYLAHFLRQPRMVDFAASRATGVNLPRLSPKALAELDIPLPPLEEQKRIAAILDQADTLRRLRRRAVDRLNTLGQSIFQEMFGDTATNPRNFPRRPLGKIIKFVGGSQPPKSKFTYEPGPDRVRLVQTRDFRTEKYMTFVPASLARRPFCETDVLIGRYGPPVFQIFRGLSGTYNVALMKAEPIGHINSDFVFYLLREPVLNKYVVDNSERTAGQSGVNLALLESYMAFLPPPESIRSFSSALEHVVRLQKFAELGHGQSEALFVSLQSRAFRGEL